VWYSGCVACCRCIRASDCKRCHAAQLDIETSHLFASYYMSGSVVSFQEKGGKGQLPPKFLSSWRVRREAFGRSIPSLRLVARMIRLPPAPGRRSLVFPCPRQIWWIQVVGGRFRLHFSRVMARNHLELRNRSERSGLLGHCQILTFGKCIFWYNKQQNVGL